MIALRLEIKVKQYIYFRFRREGNYLILNIIIEKSLTVKFYQILIKQLTKY